MKKHSKVLVILLSFTLLVTAFVLVIGAETGNAAEVTIGETSTEYETLEAALYATVGQEATVKLLSNAVVNIYNFGVNSNLTIDLNEHTLTTARVGGSATEPALTFNVANNVKFSIVGNGTVNVCGRLILANGTGSEIKIAGDATGITINHEDGDSTWWQPAIRSNDNSMTIENVSMTSSAAHDVILYTIGGTSVYKNFKLTSTGATSNMMQINGTNTFTNSEITSNAALTGTMFKMTGTSSFDGCEIISNVAIPTMIQTDSGTHEFKNSQITSVGTANAAISLSGNAVFTNTDILYTGDTSSVISVNENAKLDFIGSKLSVADVNTYSYGAIYTDLGTTVNINYSLITTAGYHTFLVKTSEDGTACNTCDINIDNSTILANYGAGQSSSDRKASLIFTDQWGGSAPIHKPVEISNSYVQVYNNIWPNSGSADNTIIFNNCTVKSTGALSYGPNVQFYNNSVVIASALINKAGPSATFSEGTRLSEAAFNAANGASNVKFEDTENEYEIIYDPASNADAPYVVVKKGTVSNAIVPDNILFYDFKNPSFWHTAYFYNDTESTEGGQVNKVLVNGEAAWCYTSTGTKYDASDPNIVYNEGGTKYAMNAYNVLVLDIDITSNDVFTMGNLTVYSRNNNGGTEQPVLNISDDGTVTLATWPVAGVTNPELEASVKLTAGQWNHISVVIDSSIYTETDSETSEPVTYNLGRAYVYVNGTYLGYMTQAASQENATFYGIRYNVGKNEKAGSSIIFDNATARGYGAVTEDAPAVNVADSGKAYLTNGGMAWNNGDAVYGNYIFTSVSGVPVYDLNDALAAGVELALQDDTVKPVTSNEEGYIISNGHTLNTAYGSMPSELNSGVYHFTKAVSGIKANVAVYSDFGVNIYIPEKYVINSVSADGINYDITGLQTEIIGTDTYFKISVPKKSYQSAEDITLILNLSNNGYAYGDKQVNINVVSYAEAVLKLYASETKDAKLMYYMLGYAQASNLYFSTISGGSNEKIASILKDVSLGDYSYTNEVISRTEEEATALEETKIEVRIDLSSSNLSYIFDISNCSQAVSVTLGNDTYTAQDGGNSIKIEGLKVYNMAKEMTVTIGESTYKYNLATLVSAYESKPEFAIVNAFYMYAKAAEAYRIK